VLHLVGQLLNKLSQCVLVHSQSGSHCDLNGHCTECEHTRKLATCTVNSKF